MKIIFLIILICCMIFLASVCFILLFSIFFDFIYSLLIKTSKSFSILKNLKVRVWIGDTVYAVFMDICGSGDSEIVPYEVRYIAYDGEKWFVAGKDMELFEVGSKGAFLTKAEAEKYLRENNKSDSQTSGKVKKSYESPKVEIIEKTNIFASACQIEVE